VNNIFDASALDSNFQSLIKGAIVIGAVAFDAFSRHR
jgi:ribose/xylose/arabinose/galactoside ABC-type transport system permease subunit